MAAGFPLDRIELLDDVTGATCCLLSDLAGFITGSTITVDGSMDMLGQELACNGPALKVEAMTEAELTWLGVQLIGVTTLDESGL